MAWVAVDKNGCEYIFNYKPVREELYFECDESYYESIYIKLPKCSIKKLIGRELTWDDEPVELK